MYLSNEQIIDLTKNLMPKKSSTTSTKYSTTNYYDNKEISQLCKEEIRKEKNKELGTIFEENIRNTCEVEYGWQSSDIPRNFFYREITYNEKIYFITKFANVKAKNFIIELNPEDNNCFFTNNDGSIELIISENVKHSFITFRKKEFVVGPPRQLECDGVFENVNLEDLNFDPNEVKLLYNNTSSSLEQKNYDYAFIEIKLSILRKEDLINQLRKDNRVMSKIVGDNCLYLGFIGLNEDYDFNEKNYIFPSNCIIYGIKNNFFEQRNILRYYDWKLISDFNCFREEVREEISNIREEVNNIKEEINNIKEEINNVKKTMKDEISKMKKELMSFIAKEIKKLPLKRKNARSFIGKKRRRH